MKVTAITAQQKNQHRVNIMVDDAYRFSLDMFQVGELNIRIGKEYTEEELTNLETESQFGKMYARALEYCLSRPHSAKEVRDYLYRKTRDTRTKTGGIKKGISTEIGRRVFERLDERGYVNDEKFAQFWIENRNMVKGVSKRMLTAELQAKGIEKQVIERFLSESARSDKDELQKMIVKKRSRHADDQKFMQYLARQGFSYDAIKEALRSTEA